MRVSTQNRIGLTKDEKPVEYRQASLPPGRELLAPVDENPLRVCHAECEPV